MLGPLTSNGVRTVRVGVVATAVFGLVSCSGAADLIPHQVKADGFRVSMVGKATRTQETLPSGDTYVQYTSEFGNFAASVLSAPASSRFDLDRTMKAAATSYQGKASGVVHSTFQGLPAIDASITATTSVGLTLTHLLRIVADKNKLYQLECLLPDATPSADCTAFRDSFAVG